MSEAVSHRMTIDEIEPNRDGELLATLVDEAGRVAVIPLALLPEGARLNQVVDIEFRIDEDAGAERCARIRRLQRRMFQRRGE